jgi:hypothetical protein
MLILAINELCDFASKRAQIKRGRARYFFFAILNSKGFKQLKLRIKTIIIRCIFGLLKILSQKFTLHCYYFGYV